MSMKWLAPLSLVLSLGGGAMLSACGEGSIAAATTVLNLGAPAYPTLAVTQSTLPASTTIPPLPGQRTGQQTYVVQYGDQLPMIANIYSVPVDAIAVANGWVEGSEHLIYPGDVITIPAGGIVPYPTTTVIATAPPTTEPCIREKYTIAVGDSPTRVANRFGVTLQQLGAVNLHTSGYKNFVVGVEINIPCLS